VLLSRGHAGMSNESVFKVLADRSLPFILKRVGFWSGNLYSFEAANGSELKLNTLDGGSVACSKWAIIVGRDFYFESVRDYPVGNLWDLRKILINEPWRFPYLGVRIDKFVKISAQTTRVTSWIIKPEVLAECGKAPFWLIPESACLEELTAENIVAVTRLGQTFFASEISGSFISALDNDKAFFNQIGTTSAAAKMHSGEVVKLVGSDAIETILLGVFQALKNHPFRFLSASPFSRLGKYNWNHLGKYVCVASLVYVVATSMLVFTGSAWVGRSLESRYADAEGAFEAQRNIGVIRSQLQNYSSVIGESAPSWVVWDIFLDLKKIGVQFMSFSADNFTLSFYASSERATDVLSFLNNHPLIVSADFPVPVRQVGDIEEFSVIATFRDGAMVPQVIDLDAKSPKVGL